MSLLGQSVLAVGIAAATAVVCSAQGTGQMGSAGQEVLAKFAVFEVFVKAAVRGGNPFADAAAEAVFTSPSGGRVRLEGFHDGDGRWGFRFMPREHGAWRYEAKVLDRRADAGSPQRVAGSAVGSFLCKGQTGRGPLRISKRNRFRMEYEDGTPFYPIGVQTGGFTRVGFDGPRRTEGRWRTIPIAEWCRRFEGATTLVRWQMNPGGPAEHALALIAADGGLDRYDLKIAAKMDRLYRLQKQHGFSHILIPFEDMSLWGRRTTPFGGIRDLEQYKSLKAANLPRQEQYLRYLVARYACWVDVWEIFNEDSFAPDDYLAHLARVIREADPYDHPVTTNYARPDQAWCEIVTWHEYMGMPANRVDAYLAKEIGKFKAYGKPVINTEFGNQGWRSNYDPVKWRIAVWTAFMNESSMLFWNSSGVKSEGRRPYRGNANAYLGAASRKAFRVLNDFNRTMPIDMRPVASGYTEHNDVRVYALSNRTVTAVYVHHFSDHEKAYQLPDPLFVQTGPGTFRLRWIDPADGRLVRREQLATAQQFLVIEKIPPVKIDLACRMDRSNQRP